MQIVHGMKWCAQKLFVALHGLHFLSIDGEDEALEPCKGGALMPVHKVELAAHMHKVALEVLMHIHADCASHEVVQKLFACFAWLAFFVHGGGGGNFGALKR